jgi:hypothetical protein
VNEMSVQPTESRYQGARYEEARYEEARYEWYRRLSDDQQADLRAVLAQGWDQGLSVPELRDLLLISETRAYQLLAEAGVRLGPPSGAGPDPIRPLCTCGRQTGLASWMAAR